MDPNWKLDNVSLDLATFLDRFECRLPRTVRLLEGYCGTNKEDVLEADQILVLYKVERQKIIVGLDQLGQEICLQQNSKNKVHLLPLECDEYCTVKQLLTAKSSHFLVLDDITSSPQIVSGSKLILTSTQRRTPIFLKCQVVDQICSREVLLPLHLTGRFLPLLDGKDYYVEEVLAMNELPVNILFVSQSERATTNHLNAHSLATQENIRLTRKTDVEMVFAASFDKELSLYIFPKTLGVSVGCSFKVSAETAKNIKQCIQALEPNKMRWNKLDDLIKDSFYFTASPVRRFNLRSLQKPPTPLPRSPRPRAKQFQPPEKESIENREDLSTKRDHLPSSDVRRSFRSCQTASGKIHEEGAHESCETGKMSPMSTSRSIENTNAFSSTHSEVTDEGVYINAEIANNALQIPPLPPKLRSLSTTEGEATNARPQSPSRPVPKPRKRFNPTAKTSFLESMANECASQVLQTERREGNTAEHECTDSAQRQTALCEDLVEEACPELPPKPIFLAHAQEMDCLISQEDNPPSLPPKKQQSQVSCPIREVTENEEENQLQVLFYSAVDVADWKKVEATYELYAEVKDDGRILRENDPANFVLDVVCERDGTEADKQLEKGQRAEEKGRQQQHVINPKQVEEDSSDDENGYEEMEDFLETSLKEFITKKKQEKQTKLAVKTPPNISKSACSNNSTQCSTRTSQGSSHPSRNNDIWISSRREEDLMDLKDIEQFFKLKKQRDAALAEVEDLKKQILNPDPTEQSQPWPASERMGGTSETVSTESKTVKDENENIFVSTNFCKPFNPNTENRQELRNECGKKIEQPSPKPENTAHGNSRQIGQELEMRKIMNPTVSDDEDDYEECWEIKYVNQMFSFENESAYYVNVGEEEQTSGDHFEDRVDSVYYNTAEVETSRYLQLENSASDEDENLYVNVDTQEGNLSKFKENIPGDEMPVDGNSLFDRTLTNADSETFLVGKECNIQKLPPLPPKRHATRTGSATTEHDWQ